LRNQMIINGLRLNRKRTYTLGTVFVESVPGKL
jgi:hypothetical protein